MKNSNAMNPRKWLLCALACGVLLAQVPTAVAEDGFNTKLLEWHSMFSVSAPFLGAANPIRGINGGGVPWALDRAEGELTSDGDLKVQVRELVVAATGSNPVPFFRAEVSCVSVDNGVPVNANVLTNESETKMLGDPTRGDAIIHAKVELPSPCLAPIVFVTSPGGAWFAVIGTN